MAIANDLVVFLQHPLDLNLALTDEGELMLDRLWCPHPEISLSGQKRRRDQSPAADELSVYISNVDLTEGLAIIHHPEFMRAQPKRSQDGRNRLLNKWLNHNGHFDPSPTSISGITPRTEAG